MNITHIYVPCSICRPFMYVYIKLMIFFPFLFFLKMWVENIFLHLFKQAHVYPNKMLFSKINKLFDGFKLRGFLFCFGLLKIEEKIQKYGSYLRFLLFKTNCVYVKDKMFTSNHKLYTTQAWQMYESKEKLIASCY